MSDIHQTCAKFASETYGYFNYTRIILAFRASGTRWQSGRMKLSLSLRRREAGNHKGSEAAAQAVPDRPGEMAIAPILAGSNPLPARSKWC